MEWSGLLRSLAFLAVGASGASGESVARVWNEELLEAIRLDFPAPTVHGRNLFHTSVAMWDAWAAYDVGAVGYLHNEEAVAAGGDVEAAREEAISFAAYRVLRARYDLAVEPGRTVTLAALDARMVLLGYDKDNMETEGASAPAVGNRCALAVLDYGLTDGANESGGYADTTGYSAVNQALILDFNGTGFLDDENRWQPLAFEVAFTQNGLRAEEVQTFVGPHWGYVAPWALDGAWEMGVFAEYDPGTPPQLTGLGDGGDVAFKANNAEVIAFSSWLDADDGEVIDLSPGVRGNHRLGTNDGEGHGTNPVTGEAYAENLVKRGDYGRVVAEFWADGPESETPPGHWNTLANAVVDSEGFERRLGGSGEELGDLEWDVKVYLALNGALHDAGVVAWGLKSRYDYVRPVTSIRRLGGLGQSSDPDGVSYHPKGLPLVDGLIEVVSFASSRSGERHQGLPIGAVAVRAWAGESGVGWILAESWLPYQRDTFVTPAFAGYISGHSTFSRAAAEVLAAATGSEFFPGGLGTWTVPAGGLDFDDGPEEAVELQWATYFDAADEAGLSRLYGGIHVRVDDGPGRVVGAKIGKAAWEKVTRYFDGSVVEKFELELVDAGLQWMELKWACVPGFQYRVQRSHDLKAWADVSDPQEVDGFVGTYALAPLPEKVFYRVVVDGP